MLGDDIRFIKTSGEISRPSVLLLYQPAFWVSAAFPLFALMGLVVWKRRNDNLQGNQARFKYLRARKAALARLKTAKVLMDQAKEKEFYDEISMALIGYLEDKLHISNSEYSIERAEEELAKTGYKQYPVIDDLKTTSDKCEFIRFAPARDGAAQMNSIYEEAASVIINIERELGEIRNVN